MRSWFTRPHIDYTMGSRHFTKIQSSSSSMFSWSITFASQSVKLFEQRPISISGSCCLRWKIDRHRSLCSLVDVDADISSTSNSVTEWFLTHMATPIAFFKKVGLIITSPRLVPQLICARQSSWYTRSSRRIYRKVWAGDLNHKSWFGKKRKEGNESVLLIL